MVEVAAAIGILAVALTGMLALMTSGYRTFHAATDDAMETQIAQKVAAELQETNYFTLLSRCTPDLSSYREDDTQMGILPVRRFDYQGNELAPSEAERGRVVYLAHVRVSRSASVPALTGGASTRLGSRNLATLTIQIVRAPGALSVPLNPSLLADVPATQLRTFPTILARNNGPPNP